MTHVVLPLADVSRGRPLPTTLYLPDGGAAAVPLIVFGHGFWGHPRKFTRLCEAWRQAGFAVAAPAFPGTNEEAPEIDRDDVVEQPYDVSYVIDALLREQPRLDAARIGVGGFSLGGMTALAVGFHPRHRDPRVRAVLSIAGRFDDAFGGPYEMTETPLLVVHGTADEAIAYEDGVAVYDAARGAKQLVTIEGPHDIAQDGAPDLEEVIRATRDFWRTYLQPRRT